MIISKKISRRYKKRAKLWNLNPHCHWCGRLTILTPPGWDGNKNPADHPDLATIDHLYSRFNLLRWKPTGNDIRQVLACNKCNNSRANKEEASLSKHERFLRANLPQSVKKAKNRSLALTTYIKNHIVHV
jgi:hypothetical protein